MYQKDEHKYDDIIDVPYPRSTGRARMSMADRAAQFSPFAALTGHGAAIRETARLTDHRIELDEYEKARINERIHLAQLQDEPELVVTYFFADERKEGGQYVTITAILKKVDLMMKCLVMDHEICVPVEDILSIEGELFPN